MMHKLQSSSVLYPFTLQCHWEFRYSAHTHTHTHTHTTWLSNTNFSIFPPVSSWWNPLALVPLRGWNLINTAGHTSAKSVLCWISPSLKGLQIHWVISLVWIAGPSQVPEGRTGDGVDTVSLPGLCSGTAVVSAGVTVLQHRGINLLNQHYTPGTLTYRVMNGFFFFFFFSFFFSQAHLEHCMMKNQRAQSEKTMNHLFALVLDRF